MKLPLSGRHQNILIVNGQFVRNYEELLNTHSVGCNKMDEP